MFEQDRLVKLINNAYTAYENCTSDWGKNYWQVVIATLKRKYGRLD